MIGFALEKKDKSNSEMGYCNSEERDWVNETAHDLLSLVPCDHRSDSWGGIVRNSLPRISLAA